MGNVIEKRSAVIASFLAVLLAVVVWQFLALNNNPQLIPGPAKVATGMIELAESGLLWESILISLQRVFKGWVLGSVIAIPLGLLAGTSILARGALDPFIHFFRFVPALALTSLFILWFGIGEASKVNLIAYAVTFLVLVSTAAGASSINPDKILGARTLGANRFDLFFRIILPATFPSIFIGMRLALASAFLVIVAAEAIAAQEGIGFLIWNSRTFFRTDYMFVGILCFGILGYISDRLWKLLGQTFLSRYLTGLGDY
jgi:NitT/TauT family transport system permease protein